MSTTLECLFAANLIIIGAIVIYLFVKVSNLVERGVIHYSGPERRKRASSIDADTETNT